MLKLTENCINWIKEYFASTGAKTAIIGISGGKDSTICAALLKEALGAENVIGVLMPNGIQPDIEDSWAVVKFLGIKSHRINISGAFEALTGAIINGDIHYNTDNDPYGHYMNVKEAEEVISNDMINTNLPARIRMATLYAVAALYPNARVVNTSNMSEIYVGYSTKWGDGVGDFGPLRDCTVREVLLMGQDLGLPHELIFKIPSDGMSGKSDEEKLGLTYDQIDNYLLYTDDTELDAKIEKLHAMNEHKINPIPCYHVVGRSEWT